jgi:GTP-binding protein HflX
LPRLGSSRSEKTPIPPGTKRSSARTATKERVFLVGLDYKRRSRPKGTSTSALAAREGAEIDSSSRSHSSKAQFQKSHPILEFTAEESLDELRSLATSAGTEVAGEFLQRRDKPDAATLIGKGKLEEIAGAAASVSADLIIFDHDLTASQQRNIEKAVNIRVIDRTQLILDIFAEHARTREGQLQVEMAQLEYMLPRLAGRGIEMSQLGGGIGTRGPGETQLETDRRKIFRRVRQVKQQLENVRRIRAQQRQRRESAPLATVALVGYTNAGKSTLFNVITQAAVLESPRMFATLDPTTRALTLPSRREVLISDTVGFIRNLPHTLVSAFRATLEELQYADLILHVSDSSSPLSAEQDAQVEKVLKELEVDAKPRLRIMNKIDIAPPAHQETLRDNDETIHISAAKGIGLSTLLDRIDKLLTGDAVTRVRFRVPQFEGKILALLEAKSRIFARTYKDGLIELEVEAPQSVVRRLREWLVKGSDLELPGEQPPAAALTRKR